MGEVRHGGPVEEPPQDVFLSDDPWLGMVRADMFSWLAAHPCDCEALCECDAGPKAERVNVKVLETHDDEREAKIRAEALFSRRRKTGVMTTLEWNHCYPDRQVRTVNRYVVYGESASGPKERDDVA